MGAGRDRRPSIPGHTAMVVDMASVGHEEQTQAGCITLVNSSTSSRTRMMNWPPAHTSWKIKVKP